MAKINGTDLTIEIGTYLSGVAISLNTSVSLSVNASEVECTNKDSGGWKEILVGTKDWSMSGSSMVDYDATNGLKEARAAWLAGTSVVANFTKAVTAAGDETLYGDAYFTNIEETGEIDGVVEWTFTLSGTGELTSTDAVA